MNKKGLLKIVEYELKSRNHPSLNWDREFILNAYRKLKKENLTHDEIIRRIVKEFKGFDEDYWKQKIERVLFSEGLVERKSDDDVEDIGFEDLLLNNIQINQKEKLEIGKIVKVNDKIGIISKVLGVK